MNVDDLKSIKQQFKEFRLAEMVVTSHSRERQKLLEKAAKEEELAFTAHEGAQAAFVAHLGLTLIGGGVPAILSISYEQVILGLPEDHLYVYQKLPAGGWEEHLFGPACDDLARAFAWHQEQGIFPKHVSWEELSGPSQDTVRQYLRDNYDMRVAVECGKRIRYPRVNVAVKAESDLPEIPGKDGG